MTGDATNEFDLISTDGTPQQGEIERVSEHDWFQFNAAAGTTYAMEVQLGTLRDSTISLIDTDRETIILGNDDSESMASFIEWTCPVSGTYFINVKGFSGDTGTFTIHVDQDSAQHGGDPCDGGTVMMEHAIDRCFHVDNAQTILIDPLAENDGAIAFYQHLGFEVIGPRTFGVDECIVLRLRLPDSRCD